MSFSTDDNDSADLSVDYFDDRYVNDTQSATTTSSSELSGADDSMSTASLASDDDGDNFFAHYNKSVAKATQQQQQQQQPRTTEKLVHYTVAIPNMSGEEGPTGASLETKKPTTSSSSTNTNVSTSTRISNTTDDLVHIDALSERERASLVMQQNERVALLKEHQAKLLSKVNSALPVQTASVSASASVMTSSTSSNYHPDFDKLIDISSLPGLATRQSAPITSFALPATATTTITSSPLDTTKFIDVSNLSPQAKQELSLQCKQRALNKQAPSNSPLAALKTDRYKFYYEGQDPASLRGPQPPQQQQQGGTNALAATATSLPLRNRCRLVMGPTQDMTGKGGFEDARREYLMVVGESKQSSSTVSVDKRLVDINTLSPEKQAAVLAKAQLATPTTKTSSPLTFVNQSVSMQKRQFDALESSNYMSAPMRNIYHGLGAPLTTTTTGAPKDEGDTTKKTEKEKDKAMVTIDAKVKIRFTMDELGAMLKKRYPHFYELLSETGGRDMLRQLLEHTKLNFMIIVPSKRMQLRYKGVGLGYYVLILDVHAEIPADTALYSVATFVQRLRRLVRRIDASMLIVDNWARAVLDKDSRGRVYVMEDDEGPLTLEEEKKLLEEPPQVEEMDVEPESEGRAGEPLALPSNEPPVVERLPSEGDQEEDLQMATQRLRRGLPSEGDQDLQVVAVDEDAVQAEKRVLDQEAVTGVAETEAPFLLAVHRNTHYKERRIECLGAQMLQADYHGPTSMASYINHAPQQPLSSLGARAGQSASATARPMKPSAKLYVKIYSYEALYKKYQAGTLAPRENLTLAAQFVLDASHNYTVAKNAVALTEYELGSRVVERSAFVNHLVVLAFETPGTTALSSSRYSMTSFLLADDKAASTVYMSPREHVFLGFKQNTLHSIVVNHASPHFLGCPACQHGNYVDDEEKEAAEAAEKKARNRVRHIPTTSSVHALMHETYACAHFDQATCKQIYTRDLRFAQFLEHALPLSAPSVLDRLRAGAASAFKKTRDLTLLNRRPFQLDKFERFREQTSKALIGYGESSYAVASTTATYRFQKRYYKRKDDASSYLIEYKAREDRFSFAVLANEQGKPLTMSVTLDDLFAKGSRSVLFKLADTSLVRGATKEGGLKAKYKTSDDRGHVWLSSASPTVTYYFRLDATDLALQQIYLKFVSEKNEKYLRADLPPVIVDGKATTTSPLPAPVSKEVVAVVNAVPAPTTTKPMVSREPVPRKKQPLVPTPTPVKKSSGDPFLKGVCVFFARESHLTLKIGVANAMAMQMRMEAYVSNWRASFDTDCDVTAAVEFLGRFRGALADYAAKAGFKLDDQTVPQLGDEAMKIIMDNGYTLPTEEQFKQFAAPMKLQFSCSEHRVMVARTEYSQAELDTLAKYVVGQYKPLFEQEASRRNTQFVTYYSRVALLVGLCAKSLQKTT